MKLLLDTHALLWRLADDPRLGPKAIGLIADRDTDVLVSAASLWEIVVKVRVETIEADSEKTGRQIRQDGFRRLAIEPAHLTTLATMPRHHRDPFDHLLIAQAISEDSMLVSEDDALRAYPVGILRCAE